MPIPTHLNEADYAKLFPDFVDEFPEVADDEHYIDAWLLNSALSSILAIEQYLIDNPPGSAAAEGDDIIGEDGQYEIPIPPATYPSYKTCLAWDSNLMAEYVRNGVNIFGVIGTYGDPVPQPGDYRYYKVEWSNNWGAGLVGMGVIWLCDGDGVKQNDETMPHWSSSNIINGTAPELSNTNETDYFQLTTAYPGWWEVDLGTIQKINILKTRSYSGDSTRGFKDFTLYGSNDRVEYSEIYTGQTTNVATLQTFNLP